ncbi:nitrate reductase molybdenum cofactor assembly chaperone [Futiania mangrovi]|uniref:Nitrate reductase molybdenum cofactor assembly chaperone n=1 Tax=Futiania mangrovi TaxID=2959716 RepID=A0A9J6PJ71_9PROT|nr:nitrate reductase molybdenum cofactor assembly chaperone [Futiania mangrovii]MCP1336599.1 nitrate reductase molybdenum cofactor assembly chaperone [Futiania mangrovii]
MQMTLKALSALLTYPGRELQAAIPEIRAALASDGLLGPRDVRALGPLLDELERDDLYALEERYVALFDRSRTLSLNLFEHVHGESRDRGGAMVDLLETYRAGGYAPVGNELPDHLPILLEFLSVRPLAESRAILADAAHILEALRVRLDRRGSDYAAVFAALTRIAGATPDADALAGLSNEAEEDPDDLAALDATWEEAQVTFGPDPNAGCPATRDMLARMDMPVSAAPGRAAN